MSTHNRSFILVFIGMLLLLLSACSQTGTKQKAAQENEVIRVVEAYELALKNYDAARAITHLHPELIKNTYGSEANYYRALERAFSAIKRDGGIIKTEKRELEIDGDTASVISTIKTRKAQQEGLLKLERTDGRWLIVKLP